MASSSGRDMKLSKTLSWILRHGAPEVGISLDAEGYAPVDEILKLKEFFNFQLNDIQRVVSENTKQRFHLKEEQKRWFIRANQGHTLEVENLDLKPVIAASEYPIVIHGTFWKNWPSIKSQGLSRMRRHHIHFAPGLPGEGQVISGMRSNCNLLIYINLEKALNEGIQFFISSNNVILCAGNSNGFLEPKYFQKVLRNDKGSWKDIDL